MNAADGNGMAVKQAEESFAEIVSTRKRMVFNTALSIVQNEADAEDILQEVFIKLYEKLDDFRGESTLSTWIYRITVSTALDFEKHKNRQRRGGLLKRIFVTTEKEEPFHFDHPGILLDKKEEATVLFGAIKKLPGNQKIAFLLNKTEGLSNKEVADVMEISLQAAESLQIRARDNLRKILKEYYERHFK